MICKRCIYDDTIPDIKFDSEGVCNYCHQTDRLNNMYPTGKKGEKYLFQLAEKIKKESKKKKYDVVVGVSGGCDSSFLLYYAKEILKLRVLAVHFDNTWNSKIAVENIMTMTKKLDIDLFTYVVDFEEYNDIFKSFMLASVPDIDTPADIGLATTHYLAAKKYGIKYIFEGHSFRTEGISPVGWFYMDAKYIQNIHSKFGKIKMKTFPNLWLTSWLKWLIIDKIKKIRPLYYLDYDKEKTKEFLQKKFGWQWYGGHHMENRTSYFTNNFWLPLKFGLDLRYSEYSALIRSGQMDRKDALKKIKEPKPFRKDILDEIKKRLSFSDKEFEMVMQNENKIFLDYKTYKTFFEKYRNFFSILDKYQLIPHSFYLKYTKKYDEKILRERLINKTKTVPIKFINKSEDIL